ncbi:hypothetical protein GCM10010123_15430 [Pilimelia anulata]|uniref:Uncharacterized protein n=1 Tax=Pilimelia anulata TaxID=53371 RepID=A0A8J3B181_9ACTN|nr:hypothetical protein GCM10010123_15430 [Pilimelia anulata]
MRYLTLVLSASALAAATLAAPAAAAPRPAADAARAAALAAPAAKPPARRAAPKPAARITSLPGIRPELIRGLDRAGAATLRAYVDRRTRAGQPVRPRAGADTGRLVVGATDAATGAPVTGVCAFLLAESAHEQCDRGTGVTFRRVPADTELLVLVEANPYRYYLTTATMTRVGPGEAKQLNLKLGIGGVVTSQVVDKSTGRGAGDVAFELRASGVLSGGAGLGFGQSDATGALRSLPVEPGDYQIFALPSLRSGLGAQWVGARGGTGLQHRAITVTVRAGAETAVPTVRLDPGGTLEARVIGADGNPATDAFVSSELWRYTDRISSGWGTDADGYVVLPNLGPYDWSLRFVPQSGVPQWAGGSITAADAATVRVRPDAVREWTVRLAVGTKLSGAVTTAPDGDRLLMLAHARTGEVAAGVLVGNADATYAVELLGGQPIKARQLLLTADAPAPVEGWHDNVRTFAEATAVPVAQQDATTADLRFPAAG